MTFCTLGGRGGGHSGCFCSEPFVDCLKVNTFTYGYISTLGILGKHFNEGGWCFCFVVDYAECMCHMF